MAPSNAAESRKPSWARRWRVVLGAATLFAGACIAPHAEQRPAPAAMSTAPPGAPIAPTDGGVPSTESDWKARTAPVCAAVPPVDAGKIDVPGSTVDWAKLDAGAVPSHTISNASRVVAGMRAGFRLCYQEELRRTLGAAGTIRLTIRVGCDGWVTAVHGIARGNDQEAVDCMIKVVTGSRFDPPEGGSAVIAVPVTFVKQ